MKGHSIKMEKYSEISILRFLIRVIVIVIILFQTTIQSQESTLADWVDYASREYEIIPDITYAAANNTALKLDLYLPRNRETPLNALIFYHGGGWVSRQKEQDVLQLLPYLFMGWAVINVEYRLASNSLAPAAVEDCRCAFRWVINHAKQYNIDTSKIVLSGTSAGAHLALISGMLPVNSVFDRQCAVHESIRWTNGCEPEMKAAAIVNWYGITDVAYLLEGPSAKHYAIEWFGSNSNRIELAKELSPINYVRSGLPPIISIHGDNDNIVPYKDAVKFHEALVKFGIPNKLITIAEAKHGGFSRKAMIDSWATIREFLRENNILK